MSIRAFVGATFIVPGVLLLGGCSSDPSQQEGGVVANLDQGVAARVGPVEIRADVIAKFAAAQNLSLEEVRDGAVRDALFALGAEKEALDQATMVRPAVRARLARARLAAIEAETAQPPPTDEEVEAATARHFLELDRPEGFRVIHAVARVPDDADDATKEKARALATRVASAVADAEDASEFESRAKEVETDGVDLLVEALEPVAADGRVLHPSGGQFVEPFAAAAARLSRPGEKSPVVETEFGFHVMMLLEKTPGKRIRIEERRAILGSEILANRARKETGLLLERLRNERSVHVERSAFALIDGLQVLTP